VVCHGVEVLGADQAVEALYEGQLLGCYVCAKGDLAAYLDEGVVENEHHSGKVPCPLLVPEQHLSDVADIFDFRVAETKFPTVLSIPRFPQRQFYTTYQTVKDVYSTIPATTTVNIRPGTRPSTE